MAFSVIVIKNCKGNWEFLSSTVADPIEESAEPDKKSVWELNS